MSKGKWIKTNTSPCYKGDIPTFEEYTELLKSFYSKRVITHRRAYDRDFVATKWRSLIEDMKKTRFRDYSKSNYNLLMKTGLIKRQKRLLPKSKQIK